MVLDLFKLDGKVALVTGANRGLGFAMAQGLAAAGADIVGVSRSGDDAAIKAIDALLKADAGAKYERSRLLYFRGRCEYLAGR